METKGFDVESGVGRLRDEEEASTKAVGYGRATTIRFAQTPTRPFARPLQPRSPASGAARVMPSSRASTDSILSNPLPASSIQERIRQLDMTVAADDDSIASFDSIPLVRSEICTVFMR